MKPLLLFLALSAVFLTIADEKYLLTRQPSSSAQVGEQVTVPPGGVFIADNTGKIKPRLMVPADISGIWGAGTVVSNFPQLQAALSNASVKRIMLASDITVTSNITVPAPITVSYNGYKLKEHTSQTITYMGGVDAGRYQIFENWEAGDIKGCFIDGVACPEWWGLQANFNERAINAAAKCFIHGLFGIEISLGTGTYNVSGPIDLSGTSSVLRGQGEGRTFISSTATWDPNSFVECRLWDHADGLVTGFKNHSAMVWMGNETQGNFTFRTSVEGITFNAYYANKAFPTKRISLISSKGWVEESSFIRNVGGSYFSGVGIGFPQHVLPSAPGSFSVSVINGLEIRGLWLNQGTRRDCYPMYFTNNNVRTSISDFTIGMNVPKELSSLADVTPELVFDWPRYGIVAAGNHIQIHNGHIEGVQVCIFEQSNFEGVSGADIANIDANWLMRGSMVYYNQPVVNYNDPAKPPPSLASQITNFPANGTRTRPFLDEYSTVILISTAPVVNSVDGLNQKDSCVIHNVNALGHCDYLLRDPVYGVHVSAWGQGQFPATATGTLKQYIRNNAWPLPTNSGATDPPTWVAGTPYFGTPLEAPPAIPGDKTYFTLIQ